MRNCSECGAPLENEKHELCYDCWRYNEYLSKVYSAELGGNPRFLHKIGRFRKPRYDGNHIIAAEKMIGRKLKKSEEVHHINGKNWDNRPENLIVCKDKKEHSYLESNPYIAFLYKKIGREKTQQLIKEYKEKEKKKQEEYYKTHCKFCDAHVEEDWNWCPKCDKKIR